MSSSLPSSPPVSPLEDPSTSPALPDPGKPDRFIQRLLADVESILSRGEIVKDFCHCCETPITASSNLTIAASRPYLTDHVKCETCGKLIEEKFYLDEDDQRIHCSPCFLDLKTSKCARCHTAITGQMVSLPAGAPGTGADGKQDYHAACFVCETCGESLMSGYHPYERKMVCDGCYKEAKLPKCSKCRKRIGGESGTYVVLRGISFHTSCFVCVKCEAPLANQEAYIWNADGPDYVCRPCCKTLSKESRP